MESFHEMLKKKYPHLEKSELAYDPDTFAQVKADGYNKSVGDLDGIDCQKCNNKGRIAGAKRDGSADIYFQECICMTMRRCIWKMERSGLKNVIRELTFDRFETRHDWQKTAKAKALGYSTDPDGWFLACGQSGSGKTHLCTAICRELLLAWNQVVYMPWRQDVAELKAMSLDADARAKKLDDLKQAEILYIDDLFKSGANADGIARPTAADVSLAFEIVNHRYINHLSTIFSTELYPEELLQVDEATGGRIIERAKCNILAIGKDIGKNYRLRGVVML